MHISRRILASCRCCEFCEAICAPAKDGFSPGLCARGGGHLYRCYLAVFDLEATTYTSMPAVRRPMCSDFSTELAIFSTLMQSALCSHFFVENSR
jgi:hypothetical protein